MRNRARDGSFLFGQKGATTFFDRFGNFDPSRAGFGAVERQSTTPYSESVIQDSQTLGASAIAAVEDEAMGVHDRRGANEPPVCPERRTGSRTRGAKDAFRRVVVS